VVYVNDLAEFMDVGVPIELDAIGNALTMPLSTE